MKKTVYGAIFDVYKAKFYYFNEKNFNFFKLFFKNTNLRKCILNENINVSLENI